MAKYSRFCLRGGGKVAVHKLQQSEKQKVVRAAVMRLSLALLVKVRLICLSVSLREVSARSRQAVL